MISLSEIVDKRQIEIDLINEAVFANNIYLEDVMNF